MGRRHVGASAGGVSTLLEILEVYSAYGHARGYEGLYVSTLLEILAWTLFA